TRPRDRERRRRPVSPPMLAAHPASKRSWSCPHPHGPRPRAWGPTEPPRPPNPRKENPHGNPSLVSVTYRDETAPPPVTLPQGRTTPAEAAILRRGVRDNLYQVAIIPPCWHGPHACRDRAQ